VISSIEAGRNAQIARVALDIPGSDGFDYVVPPACQDGLTVGSWVLIPWGRTRRIGLVIALLADTEVPPEKLRALISRLEDAPAPDPRWFELLEFASTYYHRPFGEVALPAIPKLLRTPAAARSRGSPFERARGRAPRAVEPGIPPADPLPLTSAQQAAIGVLQAARGFSVHLLHGVTGSGKTEVYLQWLACVLATDAAAQVLLLVPEIALTPQLIRQLQGRFRGEPVAVLHSDLPDGERAAHWLAVAEGRVRVVVGTRLAVLTPMPGLCAIVVDEEHDPSYKQHEGVRYSARDLAVVLAQQRQIPVLLGSATPSLESWLAARRGRYRLLSMPERVGGGQLPQLELLEPRARQQRHGLLGETVDAIGQALAAGRQALVFLNRRGYAPVLGCDACGWLSRCESCTAFRVLHRNALATAGGRPARYRLVCHHCGADGPVPRHCPECGNLDLSPVGRGTQRLEEGLAELFAQARIARVDRDVARRRHAARAAIDAAHAGEVDILVGTQMLAKGHDFRRLSVVAVLDVDSALYSSDFRAPERLFALMMQVAGRAGRSAAGARVLIQTRFPAHPLFNALARQDYDGFADELLAERQQAGLPPFVFLALLRAEAPVLQAATDFLDQAAQIGRELLGRTDDPTVPTPGVRPQARAASAGAATGPQVRVYDPVPMPMMRLAGKERAQLLIECESRAALHAFLRDWLARLSEIRSPVRWLLEVDPQEI
jgi:primosomal protein N' (replication factor Y)